MQRNYFIKTYGCQMNENDSEIICGMLEAEGYNKTEDISAAGLIITNTCSVRGGAERKAEGFISLASNLKKKDPGVIIGVVGCMAERLGTNLLEKFSMIDFALGPNMEQKLPEVLASLKRSGARVSLAGDSKEFKDSSISARERSSNAWITIMEGCDNYCSYCIVPYVRGREKSRPVEDIYREVDSLDGSVFREITLLGQNVNSYRYGLPLLFKKLSEAEGIFRIRFMTSHPRDMSDEIIRSVRDNPKVCENFHIPFQSGDDGILRLMNRGYTRAQYISLVKKIREKVPGASITSDAIAGFPQETEDQFAGTISLIEELELDSVNTLAFDPRPQTAASKMEGMVPKEEINRRLQVLIRTVERTALSRNKKLEGSLQEIMAEKDGVGRTRTNKIVRFDPCGKCPGDIFDVRIRSSHPHGYCRRKLLADIIKVAEGDINIYER